MFCRSFSILHQGLKAWGVLLLCLCLLICGGCQSQTATSSEVINLTLWHGINPPPNRDVFQALVDKFNQTHSQIQINAYYVGQPDQQMPKILTAVVGNASPDILWYSPQITGQLVELDAIIPLEDWLDRSPLKAEIDPTLFEAMELQDQTWSIPMAVNNTAIFYRPSLFEAAGITKLPLTWEEFRVTAQQLTRDLDGDGDFDQHAIILPLGKGEWTVFTWLPFMYSAGGELIENNEVDLVNSGAISALQFWSDLLNDGSAILSPPERGYEQDDFISGKVAMQITGPWTIGYLQSVGIDFGVFPIPALDKQATVVGGEHLFVMRTTPEHQEAALTFLEYVLSQDFQTDWSLGTGYLPVNLKTRQSQAYQDFVSQQPSLQVFLQQMAWARSRPIIAGYRRLSENLGRAIEASLLGENPQDALKQAENRLKLML
ncbi:MAG: ABC transporter substrate-binding protein [Cyanobacteria bacterium J06592_8]